MARPNVTIIKRNGRLGRRGANTDAVFAMVLSAPAIVGAANMQNSTVYPMASIRDAISIGITADYDDTNNVLVFHHIDRFFKRNANGFLYFLSAPQTATLTSMADVASDFAKKLLREQGGKVKYIAIGRNPLAVYAPVSLTGLDSDVLTAVVKAQSLYDDEFAKFRYASFLIEGRGFNGTAAAAKDLRTLNAPNVSVTIAADPAISQAKPEYNDYAAIGDILGMISLAAVSQDPGELTSVFNLSDPGRDMFVTAGLSSNNDINSYGDADLNQLNTKGYIFPDVTSGVDGFYISDSHTCSPLVDNDFAYIENNRTIEKMIYLARTALLPKVKSRLKVDDQTGELSSADLKTLESIGKKALERMLDDGDLSGNIDCYVPEGQNLLSGVDLNIEIAATPLSIARQLVIGIGFSNSFKS